MANLRCMRRAFQSGSANSICCSKASPLHVHDTVEWLPRCVKLESELDVVEAQRAACLPPSAHPLCDAVQVQNVLCHLHGYMPRLLCWSCLDTLVSPLSLLRPGHHELQPSKDLRQIPIDPATSRVGNYVGLLEAEPGMAQSTSRPCSRRGCFARTCCHEWEPWMVRAGGSPATPLSMTACASPYESCAHEQMTVRPAHWERMLPSCRLAAKASKRQS